MSLCKLLVVTNRKLCRINFLEQLNKIAEAKPSGIILREKDLSIAEYEALAGKVIKLCDRYHVQCILHTHSSAARHLGCKNIQLSFPLFQQQFANLAEFDEIGVSIHSVEEAAEAEKLGASYLIAGHIFATDCKKDLEPRGLSFLKKVLDVVTIPVYAIGGINPENAREIMTAGATGICVMSSFMKSTHPSAYADEFIQNTSSYIRNNIDLR